MVTFSWFFLPIKISFLFSGNKTEGQFPGTQKHQNNTNQTIVSRGSDTSQAFYFNYFQNIGLKPLEHILHLKIVIRRQQI